MGLLDDDNYTPPYRPPERGKGKRYEKQTVLSQDERDAELNNFDREPVTEDFGDSLFADRL